MMFSMKRLATMGLLASAGVLSAGIADAATFPCVNLDSVKPQTEIPFVGFRDLCDDTDLLPYDGASSSSGMMIDARNSEDLWYDAARYKRYGTYNPPSKVDWTVEEGFDNIWTQVYYAEENYKIFGHMRYFVSEDGTTWEEIDNIQRTEPISTNGSQDYIGFWFMKQEKKSLDKSYKHFRALFPPPCQSELDNPDVKSCITLNVPDEDKDRYYAPQLGEVVLGTVSTTLTVPTNVALEAGSTSMTVSWTAPAKAGDLEILGYTLTYMEAPPSTASPEFDTLNGYEMSVVNLPNINSVLMADLKPDTTYIVRVAAVNRNGAGELAGNVWAKTLVAGAANDVDGLIDTCDVVDIETNLPSVRGNATSDSGSSDSSVSSSSAGSSETSTSGAEAILKPIMGAAFSAVAVVAAAWFGF